MESDFPSFLVSEPGMFTPQLKSYFHSFKLVKIERLNKRMPRRKGEKFWKMKKIYK